MKINYDFYGQLSWKLHIEETKKISVDLLSILSDGDSYFSWLLFGN